MLQFPANKTVQAIKELNRCNMIEIKNAKHQQEEMGHNLRFQYPLQGLQIPSLFFVFCWPNERCPLFYGSIHILHKSLFYYCVLIKKVYTALFFATTQDLCVVCYCTKLHKLPSNKPTYICYKHTYHGSIERFLFTVFLVIGFIIASTKNISNINYYSLSHTILLLFLYAHFAM